MTDPRNGLVSIDTLRRECVPALMDEFAEKEMISRERLHECLSRDPLITEILFTDPLGDLTKWARFDCLVVSAGTTVIIEDKGRTEKSTRWPTWFIDEDKIADLQRIEQETGIKCAWTSSFTDNVILLWPIDAPNYPEVKWLPVKTCNRARGMAQKSVLHYHPKNAVRL